MMYDGDGAGTQEKRCTQCHEILPLSAFYLSPTGRKSVRAWCKKCCAEYRATVAVKKYSREYHKQYRIRNREKLKAKDKIRRKKKGKETDLKRDYGISIRTYKALMDSQENVCAICGCGWTEQRKHAGNSPHIDHDHSSNKIRGILCSKCNRMLGCANDDVRILKNAIGYLLDAAMKIELGLLIDVNGRINTTCQSNTGTTNKGRRYRMSECKECPKLKSEISTLKMQKESVIIDVQALRQEIDAKNTMLDARAQDLARAKDRNREVVKARNDAIANRDDALAETRKWQDKCKALQGELTEAKRKGATHERD